MMGIMDFASKFLPNVVNATDKKRTLPNFSMNNPYFRPPARCVDDDDEESSSSSEEEHNKSKRKLRRKKTVKEDPIKKKRLQQKIKKSLQAHVERVAGAAIAKSKENQPKLSNQRYYIKTKPSLTRRTTSEPQQCKISHTHQPPDTIHKEVKPSHTTKKQSKEIQTKDDVPINPVSIMDKEIETFKMKKESFISYLQNLQKEIKDLKIPDKKLEEGDDNDVRNKNGGDEIGAGEKLNRTKVKSKTVSHHSKSNSSSAGDEVTTDLDLKKYDDKRSKSKSTSKSVSSGTKGKLKDDKHRNKSKVKLTKHKKTKNATEPVYGGRLRIKGYQEAFVGNLDLKALMPKLEKLATEKEVVPTVVKNQKLKNYVKRIK